MLGIDTQAAKVMPGVVTVLSSQDLGEHRMPAINPLLPVLHQEDFTLLATHTLTYVGQPVAVVVAHTRQQATAAAAHAPDRAGRRLATETR